MWVSLPTVPGAIGRALGAGGPKRGSVRTLDRRLPETRQRTVVLPATWRWVRAIANPLCSGLLLSAAVATWLSSLGAINVRQMTDLGLISVLPSRYFLAFALLAAGFCVALAAQPARGPLLLAHLAVTVFMLYGTPSLVEAVPRFSVTWRHIGIVDYIIRNGRVDTSLDAYFSWPVFFILGALATRLGGLASAEPLAMWTPVALNLLYLLPLLVILRSVSKHPLLPWLGAWLFLLTNWIGQDYFSPQGINVFLYLAIIAVLLRWFQRSPGPLPARLGTLTSKARLSVIVTHEGEALPLAPWVASGLILALAGVFAFSASSHQLTPFAVLAAISLLVLAGCLRPRGLPVLFGVMTVAWISFMTTKYLQGNLSVFTSGLLNLGANLSQNVAQRLAGSADHIFVVRVRLAMTLAIWVLAALGGLRRLFQRKFDVAPLLLALAPFPLIALQPYGGEMLLRVYLFALPGMVFFGAALFLGAARSGPAKPITLAIVSLTSVLLFDGFLLARYGNERMDAFSPGEISGIERMHQVVPTGAVILGTPPSPLRFEGYELDSYDDLPDATFASGTAAPVAAAMVRAERHGSPNVYFVATRSEAAGLELTSGSAPGTMQRVVQALRESPLVCTVFATSDVTLFALPGAAGCSPRGEPVAVQPRALEQPTSAITDAWAVQHVFGGNVQAWAVAHNAAIAAGAPGNRVNPRTGMPR